MKRTLPTAQGEARGHGQSRGHGAQVSIKPPVERKDTRARVVAISQATMGDDAARFAADLVRALAAEHIAVSALVTTDDPHADAQAALSLLHEAGARDTAWVRVPRAAPEPALERALAAFGEDDWLVVLGNMLPLFYRPLLCVLVTAPRATHLPESHRIAAHAELQVSNPSPKLAQELAALIRAKALVRSPTNG